jgi:hypothetical protein
LIARLTRWVVALLCFAAGLSSLPASAGTLVCRGDCDGDHRIAVDELVTAVNIALTTLPLSVCPEVDADGDDSVAVDELVAAVRGSLQGCTSLPTVTPTSTSTPTRAVSATPTPSATPSPSATPTSRCPPEVEPFSRGSTLSGNLAAAETELVSLRTSLVVADQRQRLRVTVSLFIQNCQRSGRVDFRISIDGLADHTETVSVPSTDACPSAFEAAAVVDVAGLQAGGHPISVFVAGEGSYVFGRVEFGPLPFVPIVRKNLSTTLSLGSDETELVDFRSTVAIAECTQLQILVSLTVARDSAASPPLDYVVRLSTAGAPDAVGTFSAGTPKAPATSELVSSYPDLPAGDRTFSVFVDQQDNGPGHYLPESFVEISSRQ